MHIVFVSHEYAHPQLPPAGGIGRFLADYTQDLVNKGHQVTVFGYSERFLEEEYKGVQLFFKKTTMTPLHYFLERVFHKLNWTKSLIPFHAKDRFRLAQRIDSFCKTNDVDIIEVNDYLGDGAFLKTDIPVVMRCHGSYKLLNKDLGFRRNDAFVFFEEEQLKHVNKIITVSEFSASRIKDLFSIHQEIKVVYNGIDIDGLYRKAFPETPRVFYFGTLSEAKGADRLIDIYNQLAIKFPNMEFAIAGKTKAYYEEEIYPKFDDQLKAKIEFLGFLEKDDILKEINKSTYVVFPSRLENFSIALLEAMSRGRICFGWDIPSFNEVLVNNENGFIVDNAKSIVNHIEELENDHLKRFEISEKSFEFIQTQFSKEMMLSESLEVYKNLIIKC